MLSNNNLSNNQIDEEMKNFSSENNFSTKKPPVLIIDDDIWIHKILTRFLKDVGLEVVSADNPIDGIVLALKHKPLLIFLDIIMPDIDGTILLQMLKKIDQTSNIPVLILSGNLSKELLGNTFKLGANGFISKPFTEELVIEKLKNVLGKSFMDMFLPENESDKQSIRVVL